MSVENEFSIDPTRFTDAQIAALTECVFGVTINPPSLTNAGNREGLSTERLPNKRGNSEKPASNRKPGLRQRAKGWSDLGGKEVTFGTDWNDENLRLNPQLKRD